MIDGDGNAKDDVKVPDSDIGKQIEAAFEDGKDLLITIVAAMGMCFSLFLLVGPRPRVSEGLLRSEVRSMIGLWRWFGQYDVGE